MGSTCPICFDDLENKVKAQPNACDHIFCLQCLEKWSKLGSFCPVDRKRYKKIINLESEDVIQVKPSKRKRSRIVYDFSAICEFCSKDDCPDTLLLCDCCDLGFHCMCLTPPLPTVPAGPWFCPTCVSVEQKLKKKKGITKENEVDYAFDYFRRDINCYESPSKKSEHLSKEESSYTSGICNKFQETKTENNQSSDEETIVDGEYNEGFEKQTKNNILDTYQNQVKKDTDIIEPTSELNKGTVLHLFSDSFKNAACAKRPNLVTDSSAINAKTEENCQFSVFESIRDVESSQKKYMDINAFAGLSLSSDTYLDQCSLCKDMISYASKKLCKICKLKYFKRHSQLYNEKRKKYTKESTPTLSNNFYTFMKSYTQVLHSKKYSSSMASTSHIERRKNSLFRELKRIHKKFPATSN